MSLAQPQGLGEEKVWGNPANGLLKGVLVQISLTLADTSKHPSASVSVAHEHTLISMLGAHECTC